MSKILVGANMTKVAIIDEIDKFILKKRALKEKKNRERGHQKKI